MSHNTAFIPPSRGGHECGIPACTRNRRPLEVRIALGRVMAANAFRVLPTLGIGDMMIAANDFCDGLDAGERVA